MTGSVVTDFLKSVPESSRQTKVAQFQWLRDECGLALPSRMAPCNRRFRRGVSPGSSNSTAPFGLSIVMGLEWIATHHSSPFVRGHAAAWFSMAMLAMRHEQARQCVINAVVEHSSDEAAVQIVCASVEVDKNPDPTKASSRPAWGVLSGLVYPGGVLTALRGMLRGREGTNSLFLDTDSPSGDPSLADGWLSMSVESPKRADASLHSLLQMHPISMTSVEAGAYHGHAAKRFILSVAEESPEFDAPAQNEIGRFSGSLAQSDDLVPTAELLRRHELRCSVLPAIYARHTRVGRAFDLLARMQRVIASVALRVSRGELSVRTTDPPGREFR